MKNKKNEPLVVEMFTIVSTTDPDYSIEVLTPDTIPIDTGDLTEDMFCINIKVYGDKPSEAFISIDCIDSERGLKYMQSLKKEWKRNLQQIVWRVLNDRIP